MTAVTPRAAKACIPRALRLCEIPAAPLVVVDVDDELDDEDEDDGADVGGTDVRTVVRDCVLLAGVTVGAVAGAPVVETLTLPPCGAAAVLPVGWLDSVRYDGGGDALLGSVSRPSPHGFASPSGCVAFGGGVV